jgi:tetratricopeptide (TPR) repeat protein
VRGMNGSRSALRAEGNSRIGNFIGGNEQSVSVTKERSATSRRSRQDDLPSRIGRTIGSESTTGKSTESIAGVREPKTATRGFVGSSAGTSVGRAGTRDTRTRTDRTRTDISREQRDSSTGDTRVAGLRDGSRTSRTSERQQRTAITSDTAVAAVRTDGTRSYRYDALRPSRVVYHDRPHSISRTYHHDYVYRDYHNRFRTWTVWPRFRFALYYDCGPWFTFQYVYPYYLRRYMFVSLGGYWPIGYRYTRYYWYGCHPYYWYGYYPVAREVYGSNYNYYTYNYYTDADGSYEQTRTVNPNIFENLADQTAGPQEPTLADTYFEEAVDAFSAGQYNTAALKFAKAMELAPDDMVLPFAYAQALLASEQYSKSAEVLRGALEKVSPEKEGVFFPRGLYPDEKTLLAQIDRLAELASQFSFDPDLQLLLGYQLLGIGRHDEAVEPLMNAGKDLKDAKAAGVLMQLLEKIKKAESKPETAAPAQTPVPATPTPAVPAPPKTPEQELPKTAPTPEKAVVPSQEPAPKLGDASIINHSRALGGAMLITSLFALGASYGIKHGIRV